MAYSAELYVHDLDRQAADALNQFPKFVKLLESYSVNYDEKAAKIDLLSTAIRLGENQMPEVYGLLPPICEQLGIDTPELYYVRDKRANAATFGSVHPCIYVTSGLVNSKTEQLRLREASDRLCREYGLSVIEKPHKAPSRPVWLDEKSGKPTRYNVYRADVREAMEFSRTPYYMEDYLRRKGYVTDFTGKHWKLRLPQYEHFTRLDTLDERWTPENIRRSMGRYATFGNRRAYISYPPQMPQELSDWFRPFHKTSHIYKLYLHYCYLLGYLPKHTDYKPTSPYLKEDLRKLDELSQQVRYMSKYGIETFDDLYADREKIQRDMDTLIARRTKLQNRIRRATPAEKETLRQEKAGVTEQITTLRKQLKLNKAIEVRSAKIQEKTDLLYANEYRAKEAQQQKKSQRRERDAR